MKKEGWRKLDRHVKCGVVLNRWCWCRKNLLWMLCMSKIPLQVLDQDQIDVQLPMCCFFFFLHHPVKKLNCFILNTKKKSLLDLYHGNKQQRVLMKTWTSACFFDIVPGAGLLLIINQNDLHLYPFPGSLCFEEPSIEAVIYNINRQILKSSSSTCWYRYRYRIELSLIRGVMEHFI